MSRVPNPGPSYTAGFPSRIRSCTSFGAYISISSLAPNGNARTYSRAHSGKSGLTSFGGVASSPPLFPSAPPRFALCKSRWYIVGSTTVCLHCSCTNFQNPVLFASSAQMWFTNSSQYNSYSFPQSKSTRLKSRCFVNPNLSNTRCRFKPLISFAVARASLSVNSISVPFGSCMIITARWHAWTKIFRTSFAIRRSSSSEIPKSNICASSFCAALLRAPCKSAPPPSGAPHSLPRARPASIVFWPFCLPAFRYFSSALRSCSTAIGPKSLHPCIITISHAIAVASFMSRMPYCDTLSGPYRYRSAICPATKTVILLSNQVLRFTEAAPSAPTSSGTYTICPVSSPFAKTRTFAMSS
mmetsp:Transcript_9318/g.34770  ORF Transcript_9318/g.34770 Transcript_9318/m.34770 type:complete len:356 (+) Transcript_9318:101-1168(+)